MHQRYSGRGSHSGTDNLVGGSRTGPVRPGAGKKGGPAATLWRDSASNRAGDGWPNRRAPGHSGSSSGRRGATVLRAGRGPRKSAWHRGTGQLQRVNRGYFCVAPSHVCFNQQTYQTHGRSWVFSCRRGFR